MGCSVVFFAFCENLLLVRVNCIGTSRTTQARGEALGIVTVGAGG